jgi:hypothetical protein
VQRLRDAAARTTKAGPEAAGEVTTMSTRKPLRTLEQVCVEDYLYPGGGGLCMPDPECEGISRAAIAEVLTCMPEEDYRRLAALVDTFRWYLPDERTRGEVMPFVMTH